MNKLLASIMVFAFGLVLMIGTIGTANAHIEGTMSFAEFRAVCAELGGTLAGSGSGATCTHTEVDEFEDRQTSGPTGWTVSGTTTETHVSTWRNAATAVGTDVTKETVITSCTNPGGQSMDTSHQHCQLP
jgi:hypothetical protein